MARTDTLGHFLTDVADAIREKGGTSETITASDFDTAIANLPSGGGADLSEYFTNVMIVSGGNGFASLVKKLPSEITLVGTSLSSGFYSFRGTEIPVFDTSSVTNFYNCFGWCVNLIAIPDLDFSQGTNFTSFAEYCSSIKTVPDLHLISKSASFSQAFRGCTNLENFPFIDLSQQRRISYIQEMFLDCPNLTDTSLDNILKMCITLANANGTKTLVYIGITSTNYPASRIEALPSYQDFVNAGWTTGY